MGGSSSNPGPAPRGSNPSSVLEGVLGPRGVEEGASKWGRWRGRKPTATHGAEPGQASVGRWTAPDGPEPLGAGGSGSGTQQPQKTWPDKGGGSYHRFPPASGIPILDFLLREGGKEEAGQQQQSIVRPVQLPAQASLLLTASNRLSFSAFSYTHRPPF